MRSSSRFLVSLAAMALVRSASLFAAEKAVLQLKWSHQFQFAGYYMAAEKGFFREEGLEVELREGGPNIDVDQEVLSGRADFGVLGSELLVKRASGKPLVAIAPFIQHSIRALIVRADSGLASPRDLAGKRIMYTSNEFEEFAALFARAGVALGELTLIENDGSANARLTSGGIDAFVGSIANQPYVLLSGGLATRSIRPLDYGVDFYGDTLFASETTARQRARLVESFAKASRKGWEYAFSHVDEAIDVVKTRYGSAKSLSALHYEAEVLKGLVLPELVEVGHSNPERWRRIAEDYALAGALPAGFEVDAMLFFSRRGAEGRRLFLAGAALLCLLLAAALAANLSLGRKYRVIRREKDYTERFLREILRSGPVGILLFSAEGMLEYANARARGLLGLGEGDVEPRPYDSLAWEPRGRGLEPLAPAELPVGRVLATGKPAYGVVLSVKRADDGERRFIEVSAAPLLKAEAIEKVAAFFTDVTEEIERGRRLEELRGAQESLLRELHHRVKNNLALVTGVLDLQKGYMLDARDADMLEHCAVRFGAMSLVQDQVYDDGYRAVLDADAYLRSVASIVGSSFGRPDVAVEVAADRILVGAGQAVPLGMLVVELVSNALAHAFPGPGRGEVAVGLRAEGPDLVLEIRDDGRGLPAGVDPKSSASLGFQLASALASQLRAAWEIESEGGTLHRFRFPAEGPYSIGSEEPTAMRR